MRRTALKVLLVLVGIILFAGKSHAACSGASPTWTAASANSVDIQACQTVASSSDTILVPASSGVAFSSTVTIASTKCLTINGQGGVTITSAADFVINASASCESRVTGFTFTNAGGNPPSSDVIVNISSSSSGWRIDHNTFTNSALSIFIALNGFGPGVIDHNTFIGGPASEMIHNLGAGAGNNGGWTNTVVPGGPNMPFIEDNTFTNAGTSAVCSSIESYYGAQVTFRHNTLSFCQVDQHGTVGEIGARWAEYYDNVFSMPTGLNSCCIGQLRGGTALFWGNTKGGSGTFNSGPLDIFEEDTGTWPLAYQPGAGFNAIANGYATCSGPRNTSPIYIWGNDAGFTVSPGNSVVSGRDYIFTTSSTTPTLQIQQQSGDTCSTTYTYVPYTYPYPLVGGGTVTISPTSHSYGSVTVGTPSGPGTTFTITSTLSTSTSLSIANVGGNTADFPNAGTGSCTATLPANSSCTYVAYFMPSIIGAESTTLTVTDSAGSQTSALSGTGIAPAPAVTFAPTGGVGLGNVIVNNPAMVVENIENSGAATLNITSITSSNPSLFAAHTTCGSSLAAGQYCEIAIAFKPTSTGAASATVSIVDNAAGSPHTFSVTGTGVAGSVPTSDQYGGSTAVPCVNITGRFHVEKLGTQWTYCTPLGNSFFLHGVYVVDYAQDAGYQTKIISKYGSAVKWVVPTLQRLQSWGFNSAYYHSNSATSPFATDPSYPLDSNGLHSIPIKMPFILQVQPALYTMQNKVLTSVTKFPTGQLLPIGSSIKDIAFGWPAIYNSTYGGFIPPTGEMDYFDPNFSVWLSNYMQTQIPNSHTSPYVDYIMGVVYDDSDELYGFGAGPDFTTLPPGLNNPHLGWLTATMTPVQNVLNVYPAVYTTNTVYTKVAWQTYLQGKYGTIGALNTAWGSTYTTFGSSGTQRTGEAVGTGNGSNKTFSHTLANLTPSPYTVQIFVNGTLFGGDLGHATSGVGNMYGVSAAVTPVQTLSGTINYSTGALSLTFVTAPSSGASITVNYVDNAWEEGGTGLMDEDGRTTHTWMGHDPYFLAGANASVVTDFNTFLTQLANQYLSVCKAAVVANLPGFLNLGPDAFGSGAAPTRAQILQAVATNLDVYTGGVGFTPSPAFQSKLDFVEANMGDKPMMGGSYLTANPDSPYAGFPLANTFASQAIRGAAYATQLSLWLGAAFTATGSHPFVGMSPFEFLDIAAQNANFGLVTLLDNAYDGHEDTTGSVTCSAPLTAYTCGGQAATYGNYISCVTAANNGIFNCLTLPAPSVSLFARREQ